MADRIMIDEEMAVRVTLILGLVSVRKRQMRFWHFEDVSVLLAARLGSVLVLLLMFSEAI